MNKKPGRPPAPPQKANPPQDPQPPLPQADSRWQRTARYGWDKGGARGGRK